MKVLVCIDDTDNMDSRGTGDLASSISEAIQTYGWGRSSFITRHQLLIHPDIPYTSHNSSMCFEADIAEQYLNSLINFAADYLTKESAPESDPGLCIVCPETTTDHIKLIEFGQKAKKEILSKPEAYALAQELGFHLSEHGGTGQGIIGALAGAGLRLSGNDGRIKGKFKIIGENNIVSVKNLLEQTKLDSVQTLDGHILEPNETIQISDWVKGILSQHHFVLPVSSTFDKAGNVWRTCTKQELRNY